MDGGLNLSDHTINSKNNLCANLLDNGPFKADYLSTDHLKEAALSASAAYLPRTCRALAASAAIHQGDTMNKHFTLACCTALLLAPLAQAPNRDPIRIGLPVPLTGPYGAEAKDQVKNAELAVAEFNEAGGLNGRKGELVVRDDKLNPAEAATRALELIEKE